MRNRDARSLVGSTRLTNVQDSSGAYRTKDDYRSTPIEFLIGILLVVGFFLGPLKMLRMGWWAYLLPDFLAVMIVLMVTIKNVLQRRPLLDSGPVTLPILLIVLTCALQLFNPEAPFIRSVLGLRTWLLYLSFFFVGYHELRSSTQVKRLYALLLFLGLVTGLYGVYQWRAGPETFAQ